MHVCAAVAALCGTGHSSQPTPSPTHLSYTQNTMIDYAQSRHNFAEYCFVGAAGGAVVSAAAVNN